MLNICWYAIKCDININAEQMYDHIFEIQSAIEIHISCIYNIYWLQNNYINIFTILILKHICLIFYFLCLTYAKYILSHQFNNTEYKHWWTNCRSEISDYIHYICTANIIYDKMLSKTLFCHRHDIMSNTWENQNKLSMYFAHV